MGQDAEEFRQLVEDAGVIMVRDYPAFYWMLRGCRIQYLDEVNGEGIAGSNGNTITFYKDFWKEKEYLVPTLIHEMIHIMLKHSFRASAFFRQLGVVAGKKEDVMEAIHQTKTLLNVIMDGKTEQYMKELGVKERYWAHDMCRQQFEDFDKMSIEEVVQALLEQNSKGQGRGGKGKGAQLAIKNESREGNDLSEAMQGDGEGNEGQGDGEGKKEKKAKGKSKGSGGQSKEKEEGDGGSEEEDGESEEKEGKGKKEPEIVRDMDEEMKKRIEEGHDVEEEVDRQIARALVNAKMAGRGAGSLERQLMKDLAKGKPLPWQIIVLRWMGAEVNKNMISTWRRQSRKFPDAIAGKMQLGKPTVRCLIDVSGSIGDREYAEFIKKVYGITKSAAVEFVFWDDGIQERKRVRFEKDMEMPPRKSGGGTQLVPVIEELSEDKTVKPTDILVVMTDGYLWDKKEAGKMLDEKFKSNPKMLITVGDMVEAKWNMVVDVTKERVLEDE